MKIRADYRHGCYILIPASELEERAMVRILPALRKRKLLAYLGSRRLKPNGPISLRLYAGGRVRSKKIVEKFGRNSTWIHHETVGTGGRTFIISGNPGNRKITKKIKSLMFCLHGKRGLIFLGTRKVSSKMLPAFALKQCKVCRTSLIGYQAIWEICDACAAACTHEYVRGPIRVFFRRQNTSSRTGQFCKKCGRAKKCSKGTRELGDDFLFRLGQTLAAKEAAGQPVEVILNT
jgi:hypothetical protein